MKDLSIIVLSYNTRDVTFQTLSSLRKPLLTSKVDTELIVVDNASSDGSSEMLKKFAQSASLFVDTYRIIFSKKNVGFSAGNNIGIKEAKGRYVLLLNSDVIAENVNLDVLIEYMDKHPKTGAITPRLELPGGHIDPASHRGFPTIWRSLCYFLKLERLFARVPFFNRIFGGYHLSHLDIQTTHEIDSPTAAFMIIRNEVLQKINGFDEQFFMYGEDLDLSYRIKELGYSVVYHPVTTAIHLKHQSGLKTSKSETKSATQKHFYNAMKLFYDKHYALQKPAFVNKLIHRAIDVKARL